MSVITNPGGSSIGGSVTGGIDTRILFIHPAGYLAQDSSFTWDTVNKVFTVDSPYSTNADAHIAFSLTSTLSRASTDAVTETYGQKTSFVISDVFDDSGNDRSINYYGNYSSIDTSGFTQGGGSGSVESALFHGHYAYLVDSTIRTVTHNGEYSEQMIGYGAIVNSRCIVNDAGAIYSGAVFGAKFAVSPSITNTASTSFSFNVYGVHAAASKQGGATPNAVYGGYFSATGGSANYGVAGTGTTACLYAPIAAAAAEGLHIDGYSGGQTGNFIRVDNAPGPAVPVMTLKAAGSLIMAETNLGAVGSIASPSIQLGGGSLGFYAVDFNVLGVTVAGVQALTIAASDQFGWSNTAVASNSVHISTTSSSTRTIVMNFQHTYTGFGGATLNLLKFTGITTSDAGVVCAAMKSTINRNNPGTRKYAGMTVDAGIDATNTMASGTPTFLGVDFIPSNAGAGNVTGGTVTMVGYRWSTIPSNYSGGGATTYFRGSYFGDNIGSAYGNSEAAPDMLLYSDGTNGIIDWNGDIQLSRRTTNILALASGDSLEVPANVAIGTTIDTLNSLTLVQTVASDIQGLTIKSTQTITGSISTAFPSAASFRVDVNAGANTVSWANANINRSVIAAGQSGTVTNNEAGIFSALDRSVASVTNQYGGLFEANVNTAGATGTITTNIGGLFTTYHSTTSAKIVTNNYGIKTDGSLPNSACTTFAGIFVTTLTSGASSTLVNYYGLDIQAPIAIKANNETRRGIRIGSMPTAGGFTGTTIVALDFLGTSGTTIDGIRFGGDVELYRSAANILNLNSGDSLTITAANLITDTTTGMKIGTGTTQKLGFWNKTPVVQPSAYTPTNVTTDRSYDANATTIDELADVLGTLIADLQSMGLIG